MNREYPCPTDCWSSIKLKPVAAREDVERIHAWCEMMREAVKGMKK